jgi:hypothetical protein
LLYTGFQTIIFSRFGALSALLCLASLSGTYLIYRTYFSLSTLFSNYFYSCLFF